MLRGTLRLAAWAAVIWLVFFVPLEGRSWARHMQELWQLPGVQAKRQLLQRQVAAAAGHLRDALPPPAGPARRKSPEHAVEPHPSRADRRALDRLVEDAQAAPPGSGAAARRRP